MSWRCPTLYGNKKSKFYEKKIKKAEKKIEKQNEIIAECKKHISAPETAQN